MSYVSHARTPEELKNEVLSDLRRRLANLAGMLNTLDKSAEAKSRNARATNELADMLQYWEKLEIIRPKRKK